MRHSSLTFGVLASLFFVLASPAQAQQTTEQGFMAWLDAKRDSLDYIEGIWMYEFGIDMEVNGSRLPPVTMRVAIFRDPSAANGFNMTSLSDGQDMNYLFRSANGQFYITRDRGNRLSRERDGTLTWRRDRAYYVLSKLYPYD